MTFFRVAFNFDPVCPMSRNSRSKVKNIVHKINERQNLLNLKFMEQVQTLIKNHLL